MRKLGVFFAIFFLVSPAWAKKIADVQIEDKITNSEGVELKLNGAGIRKKLFFKIYIAELYLENQQQEAKGVFADEGARRIVMHFLYDKVGKDKLVEGWKEGFSSNVDPESQKVLQPRIDVFNAMFDEDMVKGELIVFDYLPGKGTSVTIKGKDRGIIEGKDFNDALLAIWLGKKPVSSDLREELLSP